MGNILLTQVELFELSEKVGASAFVTWLKLRAYAEIKHVEGVGEVKLTTTNIKQTAKALNYSFVTLHRHLNTLRKNGLVDLIEVGGEDFSGLHIIVHDKVKDNFSGKNKIQISDVEGVKSSSVEEAAINKKMASMKEADAQKIEGCKMETKKQDNDSGVVSIETAVTKLVNERVNAAIINTLYELSAKLSDNNVNIEQLVTWIINNHKSLPASMLKIIIEQLAESKRVIMNTAAFIAHAVKNYNITRNSWLYRNVFLKKREKEEERRKKIEQLEAYYNGEEQGDYKPTVPFFNWLGVSFT